MSGRGILENWRTVVGCTVVLSRARTAVDPDAGKKRGGNEVEELADEAGERKRRVDKGSMEIERGIERRRKGGRKRSYLTSLQNGTVTNSD